MKQGIFRNNKALQGKDGSEMKSISASACKNYDCASKISLLSNDKGHPLFLSSVY